MTSSPPNNPIFVVGLPRSGTTLLQSLIGAHPRIAAPPELFFGRRIVQFADMWGDLNDDAVVRRIVDETLSLPNLADSGFDAERVFERARGGPRTYGGILDAVMSDYAERQGKQRWSEKSPMQRSRGIWIFNPDAQVVHIVRDPRATVASNMAKLGGWPDLLSTADAWRTFTLNNIADGAERGPSHYLRIRYEDLARSPRHVMNIVFTFLGEDFDPEYVEDPERRRSSVGVKRDLWQAAVLKPIEAPDEDAWRKVLSPVARVRLQASVAGMLTTLGYRPVPRSTVTLGHVLNIPFRTLVKVREGRTRLRARRRQTPQQRYEAEQAAHRERGRRMRRARPGSTQNKRLKGETPA